MKTLAELIEFLQWDEATEALALDTELVDLHLDSRQVKAGSVFIAMPGEQVDGMLFANSAMEQGAVAILKPTENELKNESKNNSKQAQKSPGLVILKAKNGQKVPVLEVGNLAEKLASLANWFYQCPSQKTKVIGVTGTNGKTSAAHYMAQLLTQLGQKVAIMGTLGNGVFDAKQALVPSPNTTLETVALQRTLFGFVQQQVDYVVMEVSSHAIELGRIAQIEFEAVALTQVTRDHLDFHGTEANYRLAKQKLFTQWASRHKILNLDDEVGLSLSEQLAEQQQSFIGYSQSLQAADVQLDAVTFQPNGLDVTLQLGDKHQAMSLALMGRFNLENVLCAATTVWACGFKRKAILHAVAKLHAVTGRMTVLHGKHQPTVLVDYAHTPDALEAVCEAVQEHLHEGRLWLVFGCGGDRDQGKRPLMGRVAEQQADKVILTDDNPRYEDSKVIVAGIESGLLAKKHKVIHDRVDAIEHAIAKAKQGDVVLIAGKGHETYQEIAGQRYELSDIAVAQQALHQSNTERKE